MFICMLLKCLFWGLRLVWVAASSSQPNEIGISDSNQYTIREKKTIDDNNSFRACQLETHTRSCSILSLSFSPSLDLTVREAASGGWLKKGKFCLLHLAFNSIWFENLLTLLSYISLVKKSYQIPQALLWYLVICPADCETDRHYWFGTNNQFRETTRRETL